MDPDDVLLCTACAFPNPADVGFCQRPDCGVRVLTRAELEKAARESRSVTDRIDAAAARLASIRAKVPCPAATTMSRCCVLPLLRVRGLPRRQAGFCFVLFRGAVAVGGLARRPCTVRRIALRCIAMLSLSYSRSHRRTAAVVAATMLSCRDGRDWVRLCHSAQLCY
jgi:hypothetical protein